MCKQIFGLRKDKEIIPFSQPEGLMLGQGFPLAACQLQADALAALA